jgi:hypothetical protein
MPKNLAENMASERPICECGHGPTFHHNPIGYCEHTCACSDYRPAPAATTPERDAMPLSEAIEELRIRANQERYLERRRQRDGQDNTGARVVRAIDTVLAALTPRDDPAYPPYEGAVPLKACVWKRDSTQEWVLEIEGIINDTDGNWRHTQPLTVPIEEVPGLPTHYRDEPAAATDETLESAKDAMFRATVPLAVEMEKDGAKPMSVLRLHNDRAFDAGMEYARRADPPPDVIRHIEGEFVRRILNEIEFTPGEWSGATIIKKLCESVKMEANQ